MQTAALRSPSAAAPMTRPCAVELVVFSAVDSVWQASDAAAHRTARWLASQDVPLVLVSYRPAADLLDLQRDLGIRHPFISDGGGALYIPTGYFPEVTRIGRLTGAWNVVEFRVPHGTGPAARLLASLYRLCADGVVLVGLAERADDCGLLREVDVPVVVRGDGADESVLLRDVPTAYLTDAAGPAGWTETILGSLTEHDWT